MKVELTLLGCGSSSGTPVIGCRCATCTSCDPRNQRTRASALLRANEMNFLIDTGPDLRSQALRAGLSQVDAVLYTHPHADHLNGIDDLRAFCYLNKAPLPVFGSAYTMHDIETRFYYCTKPPTPWWETPSLQTTAVDGPFSHKGVTIIPIPLLHGSWPILGWRVGKLAYLTDVSEIPEASFALLDGLDVLLIDCLREQSHRTHFGFEQALAAIAKIGAKRSVLIHMTHDFEYHSLSARLPAGVEVGYDGMVLALA